MANMYEYRIRKCEDGKFRAFLESECLPSTVIPKEKYGGERGWATREECKDDLRGYSYSPASTNNK